MAETTPARSQGAAPPAVPNALPSHSSTRPTITATNPPASLVMLPLEIHTEIVMHLPPFPTHHILRLTHPRLAYHVPIPTPPAPSDFPEETREALLRTIEFNHPYLFPSNHLPCYLCLRVLPAEKFIDKHKLRTRALGGSKGGDRWCLACRLKEKGIEGGQLVRIGGVLRVRCWDCGRFCHQGKEMDGKDFWNKRKGIKEKRAKAQKAQKANEAQRMRHGRALCGTCEGEKKKDREGLKERYAVVARQRSGGAGWKREKDGDWNGICGHWNWRPCAKRSQKEDMEHQKGKEVENGWMMV